MVIGVGGPTFRVTTKSALYWVGALARGSFVSSAGAVNAGRMETKANNPADISLFMIRSYYDPPSSARNKKREFGRARLPNDRGYKQGKPGMFRWTVLLGLNARRAVVC